MAEDETLPEDPTLRQALRDSDDQSIAETIVNGSQIDWRKLISLFLSGWLLWLSGLLSAFTSTLYRLAANGLSWIIETVFDVWALIPASQAWLVERSFEIAAQSLGNEFGVLAFAVGVLTIAAWFIAMESIIEFFRGWWS